MSNKHLSDIFGSLGLGLIIGSLLQYVPDAPGISKIFPLFIGVIFLILCWMAVRIGEGK